MSNSPGRKVGFQDDTSTVSDINDSNTVAIVDVGQCELKKIEAPLNGVLSLHLAMITYLNSSAIKRLSKDTRLNISSGIQRFFSFLSVFKVDDEVPNDCLNSYIQYQRSHKKTDSSIYGGLNFIKNGLKWCFSTSSPLSDDIKSLCRLYHSYAPKIQKPVNVPTSPLSQLFAECPYNDTQLLDSLKKLCIWIINHEAHLRSEALQMDGIRHLIGNLEFKNINEQPIFFGSLKNSSTFKEAASTLYGTIIANVRSSNNLVLKERLVADIRHPFVEEALTERQLSWVLDRSLMKAKEGVPSKCRKEYYMTQSGKEKVYIVGAFKCLSIRSLLVPTDIESFAMQCMLACEKMNHSSVEKITLDDFVKTPKGVQFYIQKGRRGENDQTNITTLHPLASTIGKTYRLFVEAMTSGQSYFNAPDQGKLLSYLYNSTKRGLLGGAGFGSASNRYIDLLQTEKSHLRNQLLQDFKESTSDLEPVFWLLSKVVEQSKKVVTQIAEYDRNRSYNLSQSIKRSEFVTERSIGLTVASIRQSAIISEAVTLVIDPNVAAQTSNHSLAVHNRVYIDRSTAKEKIESDRLFLSRIGALMEQGANLIGSLVEKTLVLDYNQALEILGLPRDDEGTYERISKKIVELGIDTDLMDSFKSDGKKIFLANKTSIALIIKYLEHIRANFDDVLNDDSFQLNKSTLAARDYFYFSAILKKFPEDVRKEGEKYADSLLFTYAKLSDLAGISKND
ncbi:hypothetical protein A8139_05080 [Marinomonas primoryensis]|uniref:Uncharacterized protein n=1 Tax=Marinomonas primoryensis TaxID=178399 RepID=A0A2Z4PPQ0_9GAMM|nr:hypothetical protein [Marinomonas primoryensis]AWX99439.1 hypothetical protein A8139_05080 [Marinomonas primoryensis]